MPKAKRNIGQEILEGIRQLKRGEHGRVMKVPSVTTIRKKTGLSQPRFAELLGVSVRMGTGSSGTIRCCPNLAADRREEPARTSRCCLAALVTELTYGMRLCAERATALRRSMSSIQSSAFSTRSGIAE